MRSGDEHASCIIHHKQDLKLHSGECATNIRCLTGRKSLETAPSAQEEASKDARVSCHGVCKVKMPCLYAEYDILRCKISYNNI